MGDFSLSGRNFVFVAVRHAILKNFHVRDDDFMDGSGRRLAGWALFALPVLRTNESAMAAIEQN